MAGRKNILEIFLEHRSALAAFLMRRSVHVNDVEDAVQDVFLNVYASQGDQEIISPKAYLFVVARNYVSKQMAQRSKSIIKEIDDTSLSNAPTEEVGADEQLYQQMRFRVFKEAIESLPPQCRKVFILRKFTDMSHKEIAKELNISTSTVERHITNALARLRIMMKQRGYGDEESQGRNSAERLAYEASSK